MNETYDVIIIGSGIGGLVAGLTFCGGAGPPSPICSITCSMSRGSRPRWPDRLEISVFLRPVSRRSVLTPNPDRRAFSVRGIRDERGHRSLCVFGPGRRQAGGGEAEGEAYGVFGGTPFSIGVARRGSSLRGLLT